MLTRRSFLASATAVLAGAAGCARIPRDTGSGLDPGDGPLRIVLLSDTHVQSPTAPAALTVNRKLAAGIRDLSSLRPHRWLINGDLTDNGYPAQFDAFLSLFRPVARTESLLVNTGNHEFYDQDAPDSLALERFRSAFGREQPYSSQVVGGLHFVMLADEQWKTAPRNPDWAWLSPAQLTWFERVLAEHRSRMTAVFLHQPLRASGQADALQAILQRNPQIRFWFSGHTHRPVDDPSQNQSADGTRFLGLGSTFYLFVSDGSTRRRDFKASHCRVMEIWPHRVLIRARDLIAGLWLDQLDITISRM